MAGKSKAVLLGNKRNAPCVYPPGIIREISECVEWVIAPGQSLREETAGQNLELPSDTEIIFSTWGMPTMNETFLENLPELKAVFYAAGSVRGFVTEAVWQRGIRIFSAAQVNAIPVAEFTVAQIILGLKHALTLRVREAADWHRANPVKDSMQGNFRSRVGLISYGAIARHVRTLLRAFDFEVLVYDPFLSTEEAEREDVRPVGMEELFKECHAVSVHSPLLEETRGLVRGCHLQLMQDDAVFINTARGAIVNQTEMIEVLRQRPDLLAILDVVHPEPPGDGDPLLELPNAWITPHIAGSMGHECGRMGSFIFNAYRDFLAGRPNDLEVRSTDMNRIA